MTGKRTGYLYALIGLGLLLGSSGCASRAVMVDLHGAEVLNVNEFDESLPVVVRVYQLAEASAFEEAEFEQLWRHDEALLGEALLSFQEIVVAPQETPRVRFRKEKEANYVGTLAIFRRPDPEGWRVVEPMARGRLGSYFGRWRHKRINVHIEENTLAIRR